MSPKKRAPRREVSTTRRQRLYASHAEAAADPEYVAQMASEADAWDASIGDGLSGVVPAAQEAK